MQISIKKRSGLYSGASSLTLNDTYCYAIHVTGPGLMRQPPKPDKCAQAPQGLGAVFGMFDKGQAATITLPVGLNRRIDLIGFPKAKLQTFGLDTTECKRLRLRVEPNFSDPTDDEKTDFYVNGNLIPEEDDEDNEDEDRLIANAVVNVVPGSQTIELVQAGPDADGLAYTCDENECSAAKRALSPFAGGDGSAATPYLVCSLAQLNNVRDYGVKDVGNYAAAGTKFHLKANIDGAGALFTPIGNCNGAGSCTNTSGYFDGDFDGMGHRISNLTINNSSGPGLGLFGKNAGSVHALRAEGININVGSNPSQIDYAGIVVGFNTGSVEIVRVKNSSITGDGMYLGGAVGANAGTVLKAVVDNTTITGNTTSVGPVKLGGVLGANFATGSLSQAAFFGSFTDANIDGRDDLDDIVGYDFVGGVVGVNNGVVDDSMAAIGSVVGHSSVGGLVGAASGLISDSATVTNSYSDVEVFETGGGTGIEFFVGSNGSYVTYTDNYYINNYNCAGTCNANGGFGSGITSKVFADRTVPANWSTSLWESLAGPYVIMLKWIDEE